MNGACRFQGLWAVGESLGALGGAPHTHTWGALLRVLPG
jgi:hypothetical protein